MDNSDKKEDLKPIIESIVKIINKKEVDDKFIEQILKRLLSLGYKSSEAKG